MELTLQKAVSDIVSDVVAENKGVEFFREQTSVDQVIHTLLLAESFDEMLVITEQLSEKYKKEIDEFNDTFKKVKAEEIDTTKKTPAEKAKAIGTLVVFIVTLPAIAFVGALVALVGVVATITALGMNIISKRDKDLGDLQTVKSLRQSAIKLKKKIDSSISKGKLSADDEKKLKSSSKDLEKFIKDSSKYLEEKTKEINDKYPEEEEE